MGLNGSLRLNGSLSTTDEDRCKTAYGVFPAAKHFPGIGHISQNTDTSATGITDGQLTAGDASLGTFKSATADHVRLMMVSSAMYPLIGPANQAVFSAAVNELARPA